MRGVSFAKGRPANAAGAVKEQGCNQVETDVIGLTAQYAWEVVAGV